MGIEVGGEPVRVVLFVIVEMGKHIQPVIVVRQRTGYGIELDGRRGEYAHGNVAVESPFAVGIQLCVKAGEAEALQGQEFRKGIVVPCLKCQRSFGKQMAQGVVLELAVPHLPHRFAAKE